MGTILRYPVVWSAVVSFWLFYLACLLLDDFRSSLRVNNLRGMIVSKKTEGLELGAVDKLLVGVRHQTPPAGGHAFDWWKGFCELT